MLSTLDLTAGAAMLRCLSCGCHNSGIIVVFLVEAFNTLCA
ncbi:hypothetical protein BsWGS_23471 [Bradybaena similaris]